MRSNGVVQGNGASAWVWQRLTALGLLILLAVHFWLLHYADPSREVVFSGVQFRLRSLSWILVDLALLAMALYHGLNGLRNVILDYQTAPGLQRTLNVVLWTLGVLFFALGARTLAAFALG